MPGKLRKCLRDKTLHNVLTSSLSKTDRDCIINVFIEYEHIADKERERAKRSEDCKYCHPQHSGVMYVMNNPEYSGIEIAMHRSGELRVRYYEEDSDTHVAQDNIIMKFCPMCGRDLREGR